MTGDVILSGFKPLTHADTYLAGVVYFLLVFPPSLLATRLAERHRQVVSLQFLRHYLPTILRAFAMAVFMLILTPLIVGLDEQAAWGFPWRILMQDPSVIARLIGSLLFADILLGLLRLPRQLHALHILVLGIITLSVAFDWVDVLGNKPPVLAGGHIKWLPNTTLLVMLTASTGLLSWLEIRLAVLLGKHLHGPSEEWVQLLMFPVSAATGFTSVFIYGAWLGSQITL